MASIKETVEYDFNSDSAKMASDIKSASNEANNLENNMEDADDSIENTTKSTDKMNESWKKTSKIIAAAGAAIAGLSVNVASDLDFIMTRIQLLTSASDTELKKMEEDIKDLSLQYGISTAEMAQGLFEIIAVGFDAADAMLVLTAATELSIANNSSLESATDSVIKVLKAYSLEATEAAFVTDVLTATMNAGAGTFEEVGGAMARTAGSAAAANVTFEEQAATVAALSTQFATMEMMATSVDAMFKEMANTSSKVNSIFMDITGSTIPDFISAGGDLAEVMDVLNQHVIDANISFFEVFSSSDAATAGMKLATTSADDYAVALDAVNNSAGMTAEAAEVMGETFKTSMDKMRIAIEQLAIAIGQALIPVIQPMVMGFTDAINAFLSLDPAIQSAILGFVGITFVVTILIPLIVFLTASIYRGVKAVYAKIVADATAIKTKLKKIAVTLSEIASTVLLTAKMVIETAKTWLLTAANWALAAAKLAVTWPIALVIAGTITLIRQFTEEETAIKNLIARIREFISQFEILVAIGEAVINTIVAITNAIRALVDILQQGAQAVLDFITPFNNLGVQEATVSFVADTSAIDNLNFGNNAMMGINSSLPNAGHYLPASNQIQSDSLMGTGKHTNNNQNIFNIELRKSKTLRQIYRDSMVIKQRGV